MAEIKIKKLEENIEKIDKRIEALEEKIEKNHDADVTRELKEELARKEKIKILYLEEKAMLERSGIILAYLEGVYDKGNGSCKEIRI